MWAQPQHSDESLALIIPYASRSIEVLHQAGFDHSFDLLPASNTKGLR
jgi:hypothetical protein